MKKAIVLVMLCILACGSIYAQSIVGKWSYGDNVPPGFPIGSQVTIEFKEDSTLNMNIKASSLSQMASGINITYNFDLTIPGKYTTTNGTLAITPDHTKEPEVNKVDYSVTGLNKKQEAKLAPMMKQYMDKMKPQLLSSMRAVFSGFIPCPYTLNENKLSFDGQTLTRTE